MESTPKGLDVGPKSGWPCCNGSTLQPYALARTGMRVLRSCCRSSSSKSENSGAGDCGCTEELSARLFRPNGVPTCSTCPHAPFRVQLKARLRFLFVVRPERRRANGGPGPLWLPHWPKRRARLRVAALEQDLSMARSKIYAYEAQAAKGSEEAAQLKQAEASGRERATGLERDFASARHDGGAPVAKTPPAASQPATPSQAAREEPPRAPVRPSQIQPVQNKTVQNKPVQHRSVQSQTTAARSQGDAPVNPNEGVQAAKLIARASILPEQGNIGAARIVLERAVGMGGAQASFALAETYDPPILPDLGTYGTQGDLAKARTLYARVEAGGSKEAKA